jgi:SAM-dependent methyltransferase
VIHPTAASGFGSDAARYDRSRPGYPDPIVDRITPLADGPVLDLAAGTGKLTRALVSRGLDVTAAEPVPEMRRVLAKTVTVRHLVSAVAEQLPFAPDSFSLVTVAQAFHWFDADRVWRELARVVRPGGHVAVVWNSRVSHTDWQRRLWELMDELEISAPWRNRENRAEPPDPWKLVDRLEHVHDDPTTAALIADRMASVSAVAVLAAGERSRVQRQVQELVAGIEPPLSLRYRARLFVYQLAGTGDRDT